MPVLADASALVQAEVEGPAAAAADSRGLYDGAATATAERALRITTASFILKVGIGNV
jgi:hypothetical protein